MILRNPQALYVLSNLEKFKNSIFAKLLQISTIFKKAVQAHKSSYLLENLKNLKNKKLRIASSDHLILNSEVKNASGSSSPKGFKNCFRNAPINYQQTMPVDRFTLVKINIIRSGNHDYKWHFYKMSLKHMSWIFTKLPFSVHFFFSWCKALQLTFISWLKD